MDYTKSSLDGERIIPPESFLLGIPSTDCKECGGNG